uniref:THAP domain-containing protein 1 n=1 Tax=Sinocyclocheilus anshuiensis TaxID=1608454 RepID=A0A671Q963_9TELE
MACAVFGCKYQKGQTVSLHILPTDPKLRSKWVQFLGNDPAKLPPKTLVCSRHFPESCYKNFTMNKMGFARKLILKAKAVPSIYNGDTARFKHQNHDTLQ